MEERGSGLVTLLNTTRSREVMLVGFRASYRRRGWAVTARDLLA
eukprot:COSAG05_NODE_19993_length_284_cov_1.108108_1_plen_43_part_01